MEASDDTTLDLLLATLRQEPQESDIDVVIGTRGGMSSPDRCNGLLVPLVLADQIYSFSRDELLDALPRVAKRKGESSPSVDDIFDRVLQLTVSLGSTDRHRALNYLAVRYPPLYTRTAQAYSQNQSLEAVDVRPSELSGAREIVEVILTYVDRQTNVADKALIRVDVTEEFPFLVTGIGPHYDH